MDLLGQSALFVALSSFAIGGSLLARNARNKLYLAFAGLCFLIFIWGLSFGLEKLQGGGLAYRVHLAANAWLAPAAIAFIRMMIRVKDGFSRRLLGLAILVATAGSLGLGLGVGLDPWLRLLLVLSPALIAILPFELMWVDRRLRRGAKRSPKLPTVGFTRRTGIYLGGIAVVFLSVMDHFPLLGPVVPVIGNLALAFYLFFLSRAITQQRLLNFGALFSRFLVLVAVALTLTAIYSLLVAWIEDSPGLFFLNSFIASFLILTLLDPLRTAVGFLTQRLLTASNRSLFQQVREAQRELTGITDPVSLYQGVLETVRLTLAPQGAAAYGLRSDGTRFQRIRSGGGEMSGSAVRELLVNHPLIGTFTSLLRRGDLPVILDQALENEIERSTSSEQREHFAALVQGMRALDANLLVPLMDGGRPLGFIAIRAPQPPEPWGGNWGLLQILYPYFEQAASTLRNMEVFVRQREKERLAALGEMSAGLAHEIRNPLGAIKGAAQFLDPAGDRPDSRFLRIIVEETDRLNRVVSQFLDYSKQSMPDFQRVDLVPLVEKTVGLLGASRPSPRIRLEFQQPGEAVRERLRVRCAPERIQQVLINLVQNAEKAMASAAETRGGTSEDAEGLIRITLDVVASVDRAPEVALAVEDDGPGISRENLEKIFIPFFTTSPKGTGLGLPICQKIVEAHRGRIDVWSEEGRGARFTVLLPGIASAAEK